MKNMQQKLKQVKEQQNSQRQYLKVHIKQYNNRIMLERVREDNSPSVYFNFQNSNQKTNEISIDKEYIPFQYTCTDKVQESMNKNFDPANSLQFQFATPPSYIRKQLCKNLYDSTKNNDKSSKNHNKIEQLSNKFKKIRNNLNTQEFFEQFDQNFVINFGDTPAKNDFITADFRKTFESCPGVAGKQSGHSKMQSRISEPVAHSKGPIQPQNEQQIQHQTQLMGQKLSKQTKQEDIEEVNCEKQNKPPNVSIRSSKLNCQIRRRVLLKNNDKIAAQLQKRKQKPINNIINQGNLFVVTANSWERWTDKPNQKKSVAQVSSQPIKRGQKTLKKAESNIFTTRQMFKQTLRSTTLDSWRKKFTIHKNQFDLKHKSRTNNIFQKPFSYLR